MKRLIEQIVKFGLVGFLCFFIDYGFMILLTEVFYINYLVSCAVSFTISVAVNYILSMLYVFQGKENVSKTAEFAVFVVLSVLGLGINQLVMWVTVELLGIFYMIAKIGATAIVMVWNFVTRKIFLEKRS